MARWPTPEACAAAPLEAVLREWQGLGYPRRARGLHDTAGSRRRRWLARHRGRAAGPAGRGRLHRASVAGPRLRRIDDPAPGRQHRAGHRPSGARQGASATFASRSIEEQLAAGRPRVAECARLHLRALRRRRAPLPSEAAVPRLPADRNLRCRAAASPSAPPERGRRSPRYHGSTRELRGAVLRAMLADPAPASIAELQNRAGAPAAGRTATDVALILDALVHEGLVIPTARMVRIN